MTTTVIELANKIISDLSTLEAEDRLEAIEWVQEAEEKRLAPSEATWRAACIEYQIWKHDVVEKAEALHRAAKQVGKTGIAAINDYNAAHDALWEVLERKPTKGTVR